MPVPRAPRAQRRNRHQPSAHSRNATITTRLCKQETPLSLLAYVSCKWTSFPQPATTYREQRVAYRTACFACLLKEFSFFIPENFHTRNTAKGGRACHHVALNRPTPMPELSTLTLKVVHACELQAFKKANYNIKPVFAPNQAKGHKFGCKRHAHKTRPQVELTRLRAYTTAVNTINWLKGRHAGTISTLIYQIIRNRHCTG